jgi:hypothetical protein
MVPFVVARGLEVAIHTLLGKPDDVPNPIGRGQHASLNPIMNGSLAHSLLLRYVSNLQFRCRGIARHVSCSHYYIVVAGLSLGLFRFLPIARSFPFLQKSKG